MNRSKGASEAPVVTELPAARHTHSCGMAQTEVIRRRMRFLGNIIEPYGSTRVVILKRRGGGVAASGPSTVSLHGP